MASSEAEVTDHDQRDTSQEELQTWQRLGRKWKEGFLIARPPDLQPQVIHYAISGGRESFCDND